jgi:8-oxo-dGTP pyrophosphatase MutT (NUDIX family)
MHRTCVRYSTEQLFGVKPGSHHTDTLPNVTDRFEGYGVPRAFACVIRERAGGRDLLVFDHPEEGTQIPKGRIDRGESTMEAAARELVEESGLDLEPYRYIGYLHRSFDHPGTGETVTEDWHLWAFRAPAGVGDTWTHFPEEEGMEFSFRWLPLDGLASSEVHPYFTDVVRKTEQMFGRPVGGG